MTKTSDTHPAVAVLRDLRREADELATTERRTEADTTARTAALAERQAEASRQARRDFVVKAQSRGIFAETATAETAATEAFATTLADPSAGVAELFDAFTALQTAHARRRTAMAGINAYMARVDRPDQTAYPALAEMVASFAAILDGVIAVRIAAAVNTVVDDGSLWVEADAAGDLAATEVK